MAFWNHKNTSIRRPNIGIGHIVALWSAVFALCLLLFLGVASLLQNQNTAQATLAEPTLIARAPSGADAVGAAPAATAVAALSGQPPVAAGTVKIAKIGVNAPLIFSTSTDLRDLSRDLTKGVIHYPGSAMPGGPGNVFITGHSSGQVWDPNPYKTVFAKLGKLKSGDTIVLVSAGREFTYRVRQVLVLRPDEIRIFQPSTVPMLTLSTCWPIGSATNRFVVEADLVT